MINCSVFLGYLKTANISSVFTSTVVFVRSWSMIVSLLQKVLEHYMSSTAKILDFYGQHF